MAANAADCDEGAVDVSNAILRMADAGDLFEDTSLKSRFKGRMEIRRAILILLKQSFHCLTVVCYHLILMFRN